MITKTFEPVRPLAAPDNGSAFYHVGVFGQQRVHYGESHWPSRGYWMVPGTTGD